MSQREDARQNPGRQHVLLCPATSCCSLQHTCAACLLSAPTDRATMCRHAAACCAKPCSSCTVCTAAARTASLHSCCWLATTADGLLVCLICAFQCVVAQQLLDKVHMCHDHAPAAVPGQLQGIESLSANRTEHQTMHEASNRRFVA
jgi:hypothetical protein